MIEVPVLALLLGLALANGFKAAERVRATLQIVGLYHKAGVDAPDSLGSDPAATRRKVEGFLTETIWAVILHFANMATCLSVFWIVFAGTTFQGSLKGLLVVLAFVSGFGSFGAAVDVMSMFRQARAGQLVLREASMTSVKLERSYRGGQMVGILAMAQYTLTCIAATYFIFKALV